MEARCVPAAVRSRQHLAEQGVCFLPAGAREPSPLPIVADGTTYSMAQQVTWLDPDHYAVGRWDGTLSIFRFSESRDAGSLITESVSSPSSEGLQMIAKLGPGVFASSNDESSILVWRRSSDSWTGITSDGLEFPSAYGVANSAAADEAGGRLHLVVGHSAGYATIWEGGRDAADLRLVRAVDLRASRPVNPWGLHNIRGVAFLGSPESCDGPRCLAVTGSEDGDLCVLRIPDGAVVSRRRFSNCARRGINSIAVTGDDLLVANCAVGPADSNLWHFAVSAEDGSLTPRGSENLRVSPHAEQVFNFCVAWGPGKDGPVFYCATEEGALWMGQVRAGRVALHGYREVTRALGAALAPNAAGRLVVVAYDLHEFVAHTGDA